MKEKSWIYESRTVDEAIEMALEELGLEREDIHVEVLEEAQKGFLGLGGKEARIRVELIGEWEVVKKPEAVVGEEDLQEDIEQEEDTAPGTGGVEKPIKMIEDILDIMGISALVEAKDEEDCVLVEVWGEDIAILIGKGGYTLDALQYLVNIGCRRTGAVDKKIVVDIEGYRKRRRARIERQAEEMASTAKSIKKSVEMPPMSATERKMVHVALRDVEGVRTESDGEGNERRVIIYPEN